MNKHNDEPHGAKTEGTERRYITKRQAAEMLGVTPRCITNFMQRRLIPFYRLGGKMVRFDPLSIREHLEANCKFEKR